MLHENDQKVEIFVFSRKFQKMGIWEFEISIWREHTSHVVLKIGDARTSLTSLTHSPELENCTQNKLKRWKQQVRKKRTFVKCPAPKPSLHYPCGEILKGWPQASPWYNHTVRVPGMMKKFIWNRDFQNWD